jgi:hypothetical protein
VTGDWKGGGHAAAGVFGTWVFDWNGVAQICFLGQAGDAPLAGDWSGGLAEIGFFRAGMWLLDHNGSGQWEGPAIDRLHFLGQAGDVPLADDWNGDGRAKIGIFRAGLWLLDSTSKPLVRPVRLEKV